MHAYEDWLLCECYDHLNVTSVDDMYGRWRYAGSSENKMK
jgi:hypothetical protein